MVVQTLYKVTTNGKIQVWQMDLDIPNSRYRTIEGLLDGKMTSSEWTISYPKNIGKSNERSSKQQATLEARAKIQRKIEECYAKDVDSARLLSNNKFSPTLAESYKDKKKLVSYPCISQPKIDGVRCIIDESNGMLSRNAKPIISCPHIYDILKPLFKYFPNIVFDGELYNHDYSDNFNKLISLMRKTKPTDQDLKESEEIVEYHIFDVFFKDEPDLSFSERRKRLIALIDGFNDKIVIVPTSYVKNEDMLDNLYFNVYLNNGYEGQMLRLNNTKYCQKRTNDLLKRKEFVDEEFEIIDILEGKGNRSGMAGRIVLKINNGLKAGTYTKSSIRGGVSFYKELFQNKQNYIGKQATCRYQNVTPDGDLRFPVVVSIRDYE